MNKKALIGAAVAVALVVGVKLAIKVNYANQQRALVGRIVYDEKADGPALVAAALQRAGAEHKRVLVTLGGNWCIWCLALDKLEHEDDAIRTALEKSFVSVKLDIGTNEALDKTWGNASKGGVPILLFLEPPDGKLLGTEPTIPLERLGGRVLEHDPEKILAVLRRYAP